MNKTLNYIPCLLGQHSIRVSWVYFDWIWNRNPWSELWFRGKTLTEFCFCVQSGSCLLLIDFENFQTAKCERRGYRKSKAKQKKKQIKFSNKKQSIWLQLNFDVFKFNAFYSVFFFRVKQEWLLRRRCRTTNEK